VPTPPGGSGAVAARGRLGGVGFLVRVLVNAGAIYFAAAVVPGVEISGVLAALGAGLVFGLINAIVRPVLLVLTLPITLVTLGLFLFVLNAFCFWLTAVLVKGFEVYGFWAAVFGAVLVSVVSWLLTAFLSDRGQVVVITRQ
jgi:putative membrane protein